VLFDNLTKHCLNRLAAAAMKVRRDGAVEFAPSLNLQNSVTWRFAIAVKDGPESIKNCNRTAMSFCIIAVFTEKNGNSRRRHCSRKIFYFDNKACLEHDSFLTAFCHLPDILTPPLAACCPRNISFSLPANVSLAVFFAEFTLTTSKREPQRNGDAEKTTRISPIRIDCHHSDCGLN
jgi:hypothetical protein